MSSRHLNQFGYCHLKRCEYCHLQQCEYFLVVVINCLVGSSKALYSKYCLVVIYNNMCNVVFMFINSDILSTRVIQSSLYSKWCLVVIYNNVSNVVVIFINSDILYCLVGSSKALYSKYCLIVIYNSVSIV